MANAVLFGLPGHKDLWLADLEAGTVTKVPTPADGPLAQADQHRSGGAPLIKDVDLAVAISSGSEIAAGFMDGG